MNSYLNSKYIPFNLNGNISTFLSNIENITDIHRRHRFVYIDKYISPIYPLCLFEKLCKILSYLPDSIFIADKKSRGKPITVFKETDISVLLLQDIVSKFDLEWGLYLPDHKNRRQFPTKEVSLFNIIGWNNKTRPYVETFSHIDLQLEYITEYYQFIHNETMYLKLVLNYLKEGIIEQYIPIHIEIRTTTNLKCLEDVPLELCMKSLRFREILDDLEEKGEEKVRKKSMSKIGEEMSIIEYAKYKFFF